jgi:hypothetical protein
MQATIQQQADLEEQVLKSAYKDELLPLTYQLNHYLSVERLVTYCLLINVGILLSAH